MLISSNSVWVYLELVFNLVLVHVSLMAARTLDTNCIDAEVKLKTTSKNAKLGERYKGLLSDLVWPSTLSFIFNLIWLKFSNTVYVLHVIRG